MKNGKVGTVGLLMATLCSAAVTTHAQIVTVPPGLNPGDPYRLVFVTSTTRDALSSAIADYNSFVSKEE